MTVVVAAAVFLTHRPALSRRAILFDDPQYLLDNYLVQNPQWASARRFFGEVLRPSTVEGYYQPLAMISLMLDCASGGSPDHLMPFHRTSLILHVANTALIVVFLYLLFGNVWVAGMSGLLFGVHPMSVEPVTWIADRKTPLAAFFALGSLLSYVRYACTRRRSWYGLALATFVFSLMSKPTTVPLPAVMLVLDFWPLRRLSRRAALEKAPFFLIAGVFAVIAVISQRHLEAMRFHSFSPGQTLLLTCHNLVFYPWKMLRPVNLSPFYAFPESISLTNHTLSACAALCAGGVLLLLLSLRWTRAAFAGWLCFFLLLSPTLLNKSYSPSVAWDKYAYLPSLGFLLVLTSAQVRLWNVLSGRTRSTAWRAALPAVALVLAGFEAAAARRYLAAWRDSETLARHMLRLAPDSAFLYNNLGLVLGREKRFDEAIQCYTKAIRLRPAFDAAWNNRGFCYDKKGDDDRALDDYTRAVTINPSYATAFNNRGASYADKGDYDRAIADCTRAINLKPRYAEAYNNRATAYFGKGDYERAFSDCNRAIELRPRYAEAYNNRGNAWSGKGEHAQAIRDYTRAIEFKRDYADAYANRAIAWYRLKRYDRAWEDVQACRRRGGSPHPEFLEALSKASGRSEGATVPKAFQSE